MRLSSAACEQRVSTGQGKCPIANFKSPISNFKFPITNHQSSLVPGHWCVQFSVDSHPPLAGQIHDSGMSKLFRQNLRVELDDSGRLTVQKREPACRDNSMALSPF